VSERPRKPFGRKFDRRGPRRPTESTEERIKRYVLHNSQMGYFTRLDTITTKFNLTENEALTLSGFLLADNKFECVHSRSGDIRLCEAGKRDELRQEEYKRMAQRDDSGETGTRKPGSDRNRQQRKPGERGQRNRGPRSASAPGDRKAGPRRSGRPAESRMRQNNSP
jgi:phosphoribosylaminoimidazole-succinocarboxamide synthase